MFVAAWSDCHADGDVLRVEVTIGADPDNKKVAVWVRCDGGTAVIGLLEAQLERARRWECVVYDSHVDLCVEPGPADPQPLTNRRESYLLPRSFESFPR